MRDGVVATSTPESVAAAPEQSLPPVGSDPARPLAGPGIHIPALDGLRGLAVIAVVLYHLWPDAVPGGWLGVGAFFTLSGFLVIGLVADEVAGGGLDYGRFYRRRVRRLLPAALLTVVTVVVWVALTDPTIRRSVAQDGFWAVLNLANWNQMADAGGYAAIFEQGASPLGHMWSLAIEEQFYLTAPLVIGLTRRPGLVVGAGLVSAMVAIAVWWGTADAYLATPVRIAEILVGGALALAVRRWPRAAAIGRLWPVALVTAVVAVLTVGESEAIVTRGFPALMALAWAVLVAAALVPGWYTRALTVDWLRWVGLRSYAIYLFHWPLIELTHWNPITVIAVTLLLAEVSYRLVEDPVRRGRVVGRPLLTLVGTSAVVAVALAVVAPHIADETFLVETDASAAALPEWFAATPPTVAGAVELAETAGTVEPAVAPDGTAPATDDAATGTDPAVAPVPASATAAIGWVPVVVVVGDSTATQVAAGLRAHADSTRTLAVVDRSTSGCSALIDALAPWRVYRVSSGYLGEFAFDGPCRTPLTDLGVVPDVVVVIDHGSAMADHRRADGTWASILDDDLRDDLRSIYRARIDEAAELGAVIVFTTAPHMVDSSGLLGDMDDPARLDAYNGLVAELAAGTPGVELLDLGAVLDEAGIDGRYPRPDGLHVDVAGATRLSADVLAPALVELAADASR